MPDFDPWDNLRWLILQFSSGLEQERKLQFKDTNGVWYDIPEVTTQDEGMYNGTS